MYIDFYYLEIIIGLMAVTVILFRIVAIGFPMFIQGVHNQDYGLIFKSFTQFV
jgi:hypothetical protein